MTSLEADIAATEGTKAEMEAALASTELYRDGEKVKETLQGLEDAKARLALLYEHWEEAVEMSK